MNTQLVSTATGWLSFRLWAWLVPAAIALVIVFAPLPASGGATISREFNLVSSQYAYTPSTIRANKGDRVSITLRSADVVHGLYLDGYGLEISADPGQTARLDFVADRAGTFRFRCSVTCGPLHPFMIGKLEVGNNTLLWRGAALAVLASVVGLWRIRR